MTKYDLAGNPLPEATGLPQQNAARAELDPAPVRYDLAGNPIPGSAKPTPTFSHGPAKSPTPPRNPSSGPYSPQAARSNGAPTQDAGGGTGRITIICGALAAIVAFTAVTVVLTRSHDVAPPTSWSTWTGRDGISCDKPGGWDVHTSEDVTGPSSPNDVGGVLFQKGPVRMELTTEPIGVFARDLLYRSSSALPDGLTGDRAKPVLELRRKERVGVYERGFVAGDVVDIQTKWGTAALQPWTADGPKFGWPQRTRGYFVAFDGVKHVATMNLQCPDSMWSRMKPVFQREIMSANENIPEDPEVKQLKQALDTMQKSAEHGGSPQYPPQQ